MFFPVPVSDLPVPPPPPPVVITVPAPATVTAAPATPHQTPQVRDAGEHPCPLGGWQPDGRPCPHPAYWGLAQGSDIPGKTLGTTDPDYGAALTAQICEAKPWIC